MPKTVVIIVSYNGLSHIKQCLEKSFTQLKDIDFMVIDNGSSDNTVEFIKKNYPTVRLIGNEKNMGFGAANNIGLRYAIQNGYDYVYLLNQDGWIYPSSLKELIKKAETSNDFGIISPLQVFPDEKRLDTSFSHNIPKELKDDYILNFENKREIYNVKGRTIQAAHWLMPVPVLNKVGVFSPSFFQWGEDTNLCRRMEYHGFKLGIVPSIHGVHDRENRIDPPYKKKLGQYISLVNIISDPNKTGRQILKEIIVKIVNCGINNPNWFFPLLWKFSISFPKLLSCRKETMKKAGAFL